MKNINVFINESIVNEANNEIVMIWDHFSPNDMIIIKDSAKKVEKVIEKLGLDLNIGSNVIKTPLFGIWWNDESGWSYEIEGNNLNDAKKKDLAFITKQYEEGVANGEMSDDYVNLESNLYGEANEWIDGDAKGMKPKDFADGFIEIIENSYVDGDSSYAIAILDYKKEEVVLSGEGSVSFMTLDQFLEIYES